MYFVKSLEEDFATKTLRHTTKVLFQTAEQILRTRILKPNTKSFGRRQRLSTTILHKNYLKTYRPQGIIFETRSRPSYVLPCDLVLLTNAKKIAVHYYRIKNNLHVYYNHSLIRGFERFVMKDFASLIRRFPSPNYAWRSVNAFRIAAGHVSLPKSKYRLVEYNEAVFEHQIHIIPVVLFGRLERGKRISKQFGLPYYRSAKEFFMRSSETRSSR